MKEILIDVDELGHVKVEAIGFEGAECEKFTAELEDALGAVEKRELKPEHRRGVVRGRTAQR